MIEVSIVIPFRNRPDSLRKCLEAIRNQDFPQERLQIVAVDNGSATDNNDIKKDFPEVFWEIETKPGSYAARNRGLEATKGKIIAFTDSDCVPAQNWISSGLAAISSTNATVIGGKIELITSSTRPLNIYEVFEEEIFGMVNQKKLVTTQNYAATANLLAYRSVFERIGYFDADLRSSGDKEWGQRATSSGECLVYSESMLVYHPRRSSFIEIFKKIKRLSGGAIIFMKKKKVGWRKTAKDVYDMSILNWKVHIFAIHKRKIKGLKFRLGFALLVESMSMLMLIEKIRILLGGDPYRGD